MRQSRYQLQKERDRIRAAADREKDTTYYLDFIPKDGQPTGVAWKPNDPWSIRLPNGRKDDPDAINDAIRRFEEQHNVESWRDVASEYKVSCLYYP